MPEKQKHLVGLVLLGMMIVLCSSCIKKDAPVRLQVDARTNQGESVSGAVVSLDGKQLGQTSDKGAFETELTVPVGHRARIEVRKDSDLYYFAPYFESFEVKDNTPLEIRLSAVLYFVPKPKPESQTPEPQSNVVISENPEAAAGQAAATVTQPSPDQAATAATAAAPDPGQSTSPEGQVTVGPQTVASGADGTESVEVAEEPEEPAAVTPAAVGVAAAETPADDITIAANTEPAAAAAVDAGESSDRKPKGDVDAVEVAPAAGGLADSVAEDDLLDLVPEADAGQPAQVTAEAEKDAGKQAEPAEEFAPSEPAVHKGPFVFTVHAFQGKIRVAGANVAMSEGVGALKPACSTNKFGRCVIRFKKAPAGPVTLVISREGYRTVEQSVTPQPDGQIRVEMVRGQTIDIFAHTKSYNHSTGIQDVEILIGGKRVGSTDRYGRFSHFHTGKPDDLVTITLKSKGYLPEAYETDFVVSDGQLSLTKYFAPVDPPPVRVAVMPVRMAGSVPEAKLALVTTTLDNAIRTAARRHVFANMAFREYPYELFEKNAAVLGVKPAELLKRGWLDSDMKTVVDSVLVPVVITGAQPAVELTVVDARGQVITAARQGIDDYADVSAIDHALSLVSKKVMRSYPFEGAVLGKEADKVTINLGHTSGRALRPGDQVDVFGVQTGKQGRSQIHKKVARLVVKEVLDGTAVCSVSHLEARSAVSRGDFVILSSRKTFGGSAAQISVNTKVSGGNKPVARANVYFNDKWIGTTDDSGKLFAGVQGSGTLKVVRQGYKEGAISTELAPGGRVDVPLVAESGFVRIETVPPGAEVSIEGKVVGKSPILKPVSVGSGFVKLKVRGPDGYKDLEMVVELSDGTLELTGERALTIEKDLLAPAAKLAKAGNHEAALEELQKVPADHSDYLAAQHEIGDIFMTRMNQPARAAEAFGNVTGNPAVAGFSDKRFIGSHINEGIALFLTGEKLAASDQEAAKAHYVKSVEVFERVIPHLRFVAPDQYSHAVHEVDYHRALARHRLWTLSKDPGVLAETVRYWKSYLDGSARSVPVDEESRAFVENAQVYYRQAVAYGSVQKDVTKQ